MYACITPKLKCIPNLLSTVNVHLLRSYSDPIENLGKLYIDGTSKAVKSTIHEQRFNAIAA